MKIIKALCKYRGMLVVAEFTKCHEGSFGKCPECGSEKFHEYAGWIECDCGGFAISKIDYDNINERQNNE